MGYLFPKEGAKINLDRIDEVKVVYVGQDVSAYLDLSASHYFLQPCSCANTEEVIAYILQHPEWRLSLQTHKLFANSLRKVEDIKKIYPMAWH